MTGPRAVKWGPAVIPAPTSPIRAGGCLFRIDTIYEDPDTRAQAVFWGGDRHEEHVTGEVVSTRSYSPYS